MVNQEPVTSVEGRRTRFSRRAGFAFWRAGMGCALLHILDQAGSRRAIVSESGLLSPGRGFGLILGGGIGFFGAILDRKRGGKAELLERTASAALAGVVLVERANINFPEINKRKTYMGGYEDALT